MYTFFINRLIGTIAIIIIVSIVAFGLIQLIPGDPAFIMLGTDATNEQIEQLRSKLWLDRPIYVQYIHWINNAIRGDFGNSLILKDKISSLLASRLAITAYLSTISLIVSVVLGIAAGIISAVRRGGILDQTVSVLSNTGIAIPPFWLGIIGVYIFGVTLGWLPIQGYISPTVDFWRSTKGIIMPVFCLAIPGIAILARQTRSSILEVIGQDYIRTAWAKGLNECTIIKKHTLKNAIIPVVTLLGLQVRYLIGGTVLVETVFNIPGLGRLITQAVFNKDFLIIQAVVLIMAVIVSVTNLLVDLSYGFLNPRIRQRIK